MHYWRYREWSGDHCNDPDRNQDVLTKAENISRDILETEVTGLGYKQ